MCNGRVIYGEMNLKGNDSTKKLGDIGANGIQATHNYWTVQNFNNTSH